MNITLIGMPGCGKTTLGRRLVKEFGGSCIDFDDEIIAKYGPLQQILDTLGEKKFLEIEESVLCKAKGEKMVFSPGGSVVYSEKAMKHFKSISKVIYLHMPFWVIEKRITNLQSRGIVGLKNKTLKELYDERDALFKKYADIIIESDSISGVEQYAALREKVQSLRT